jgi:pilus assembly protein CpaE
MALREMLKFGSSGANSPNASDSADANKKNGLQGDKIDVLLVSPNDDLKAKLAAGFAQKKHFALRTIAGTVAEVEESLLDDGLPAILLVDLKTANPAHLAALDRIKRSKFAQTPIIAISSYLDQEVVRRLMQIKVDDWLPKDCPFTDVIKSCERAFRTPTVKFGSHEAIVYSFYPASGGAGNTTLAIQTAFLVGCQKQLESTCLVDLNFQDSSIADYLDVSPAFRIEELATMPGRLDQQLLNVMLSRHSSGLAVLASPRMAARYFDVSEGLIGAVLGMLSRSFDHVVIDLPKTWFPWTDNVIWGSNFVYLTTNFTVPALRYARYVLDTVSAKVVNDAQVGVIVNKFRERLLGAGLRKRDAEQLLREKLIGFIPDCADLVQEAINRGVPISEVSRSSKLEKALLRILQEGAETPAKTSS